MASDRKALEAGCRKLADQIQAQLPPGVGMMLMLFDYGPNGSLAYVSTAQRDDMIRVMLEWIDLQLPEQ